MIGGLVPHGDGKTGYFNTSKESYRQLDFRHTDRQRLYGACSQSFFKFLFYLLRWGCKIPDAFTQSELSPLLNCRYTPTFCRCRHSLLGLCSWFLHCWSIYGHCPSRERSYVWVYLHWRRFAPFPPLLHSLPPIQCWLKWGIVVDASLEKYLDLCPHIPVGLSLSLMWEAITSCVWVRHLTAF